MDCSIDLSLSLALPGSNKSTLVSSDKLSTTSSLSNLDLSLSLGGSWYSSVARDEIQETLDGDDKQLAIVNPDQIPFNFIPKSDPENKPYYFFFDGISNQVVDEPVMKEEEQEVLLIEGPQPLPLSQLMKLEKVLTSSDVNHCSRLMIPKQYIQENVMPFLNDAEREVVNENGGMNVSVYDEDTESEHIVQFKLWKSSRCYVFTGWSGEFKKRRSLKEGILFPFLGIKTDFISLFFKEPINTITPTITRWLIYIG